MNKEKIIFMKRFSPSLLKNIKIRLFTEDKRELLVGYREDDSINNYMINKLNNLDYILCDKEPYDRMENLIKNLFIKDDEKK